MRHLCLRSSSLSRLALLLTIALPPLLAQGTPIGFVEDYALAADRGKALELLVPGTEDYYFYQCLHLLDLGKSREVGEIEKTWAQRYGRTQRLQVIENRRALLGFDKDPAATFAYLRERLGLRFDAEPTTAAKAVDLPTRLEQERIGLSTLSALALQNHPGTLDGFRDSALAALAAGNLDMPLLRNLLARTTRPDVANLPSLVARELGDQRSGGFGSLAAHHCMLRSQLDELVRLRPAVLDQQAFVATYLKRLWPAAGVDWQNDAAARAAYLDELQAFAQRLSPVHDSLKAHVLFHRLSLDLQQGAPDKPRFLAYLALPRQTNYANPDYLKTHANLGVVQFGASFATGLPQIGDDEPLVRACCAHFFATEESFEPYAPFLRPEWLRRVFATTKILAGIGDMERWYSVLNDPGYYEQLKERVEIAFPPTQRRQFAGGDAVGIDVDVKNVPTLLVKVFAIDAYDYLRDKGKEVDASIDLDGMVATHERTVTSTDSPLRRVRRHFDLPELSAPGTYVVEFVGNGVASRAVVQKGSLHHKERLGSAGHVFVVYDDAGQPLQDASLWCAGREYAADAHAEIVVPYSDRASRQKLVLRRGGIATLADFAHRTEDYRLTAGVYVDREALLAGHQARVVLRPTLLLDGVPISLTVLESPELQIVATDQAGNSSIRIVRDLVLPADRELEQTITVPDDLASLAVNLRGRVRSLSRDTTLDLASAPQTFRLNAIDALPQIVNPLLGRTPDGYVLDLLGKSGEPKADLVVPLRLLHRDFTDPIELSLKTDGKGRIRLGALAGIISLQCTGIGDDVGVWSLLPTPRTLPAAVHGAVGEVLRVPVPEGTTGLDHSELALFEHRAGEWAHDAYSHLAVAGGFVELRGLAAGDYQLLYKATGQSVDVRVDAGEVRGGMVFGRTRWLSRDGRDLLQITDVGVDGNQLRVALANAGPSARVHVVATRYLPAYDLQQRLWAPGSPAAAVVPVWRGETSYHAGREISDEYRYILDRRLATKFPGNMLHRPSLLLNPWAIAEAPTGMAGEGHGGGRFGGRGGASPATPGPGGPGSGGATEAAGTYADLDFLPAPSRLLVNLRPDKDGVVAVPLADLGAGQQVHVVAVDDDSTVSRSAVLPERPLLPRDRTLRRGLDPAKAFTEQKQIDFVAADGQAVIEDTSTATSETFDTVASVLRFYQALTKDGDLAEFAFVATWPKLTDAQKREQYSRHACHELHFFLYQKDHAFFDAVVKPYLANKADKTFLDHWLLGDNLAPFLQPWQFAHLNVFERILLTQRLPDESDNGARHVRELLELQPRDPERLGRLFDATLASGALDAPARNAPAKPQELVALQEQLKQQAGEPATGAPPAAAPAEKAKKDAKGEDEGKAADKLADKNNAAEPQLDAQAARADDFALGARAERGSDAERRAASRALYREPEATRAFAETNYWHRRVQENGDLIKANAFWRDYAERKRTAPFGSPHFVEASGSFTEMLLALAVLDLPFEAGKHAIVRDGSKQTLRAATPLLLVRREVRTAAAATDGNPVLISQNFFQLDDRYRFVDGERVDNFVRDEFVIGVVYGSQVVLTNPTSTPRRLELLLQVPAGAVPVQRGFYTRSVPVQLAAFATASIEYAFYFPAPGDFAAYPAHAGKGGTLVAAAAPSPFKVLAAPSKVDTQSWEHVSQAGTADEVVAYLGRANLQRTALDKIAWRMRERAFFGRALGLLRAGHAYDHTLWSYGILHGDAVATREYLAHADGLLCGAALSSPLLTVDPVERLSYQRIEFEPLFNGRAHQFGRRREIQNRELANQYGALLTILACRSQLDAADWMSVTYYLLLQDRVQPALAAFTHVDAAALPTRLQYDYLRAYLDFFTADHALARAIAEGYRDHPVQRWRALFADVLNQLDEAEGKAAAVSDLDNRVQQQSASAAQAPALDLEIAGRTVTVQHQNLARCEVRYYRLDVESSFSTNPFVQQSQGNFGYIEPSRSDALTLAADRTSTSFELPAALQNGNVLVEVRGGGIARRRTSFANALAVQFATSYGQLKVASAADGKPLAKVYVKVYARQTGGQVRFHKDGYTDLRGRFDYASVSDAGAGGAERFAILVLSDTDGALIREVEPPAK